MIGLIAAPMVIESAAGQTLVSSIAARNEQCPAAVAHVPSPANTSLPSAGSSTTSESGAELSAEVPSTAPMSQAGPSGRLAPRWSTGTLLSQSPAVPAGMASTTGLSENGRRVRVGPPLSVSGKSSGSVLAWSPAPARPQLESETTL
jgi:hypothetical protein